MYPQRSNRFHRPSGASDFFLVSGGSARSSLHHRLNSFQPSGLDPRNASMFRQPIVSFRVSLGPRVTSAMVLFISLMLLSAVGFGAESSWKAGAAAGVITPKEPMWMAGYAARNKPAEGTAQELYAKALALEDANGKRFVFVTLDLIGVPRTLRTALEKRLGVALGLPPDSLLLNASHTHCGPEFRVRNRPGDSESGRAEQAEAYGVFLESTIFKLVNDAVGELAPARISYHHARCGFAMNRRLPVEKTFRNSPNPEGPVDHDVPVLRVTDPEGKLRAVLFGYACHNTTLPFYQWCGDYAGFAARVSRGGESAGGGDVCDRMWGRPEPVSARQDRARAISRARAGDGGNRGTDNSAAGDHGGVEVGV
jgi:hypothetical protein